MFAAYQPVLAIWIGVAYDAYRRAVPAWWPQPRPWLPDADGDGTSSQPGER